MVERIRVFHVTSGRVGRQVENARIPIYHAYRKGLITANISTQISDASPFLSTDGVVLEYMIPETMLIQVEHENWFTPNTLLPSSNWNHIPMEYRLKMYNARLIAKGTLNSPELWSKNIEVSALAGEYFTAIHSYIHAMILIKKESSSR